MITNSLLNQHSFHLSRSDSDSNASNILKSKNNNTLEKNNGSVSIKKNDPLQHLMEQKQNIFDSKQKYLENALAKNESADSIKNKMEEYDKQISDIDKQINELKLEEQKKSMGKDDQLKEKDKDKKTNKSDNNPSGNKTQVNSEIENSDHMMNHLVSLSNNISEAKNLSHMKTSASGEKRVLESEIKIDERRGLNPVRKRERAAKLGDNIKNIEKKIEENLDDSTASNETIIANKNQKLNSNNNATNADKSDSNKENSTDHNSPKSIDDLNLLETIKLYEENKKDTHEINGAKVNSMM
ncbi:hypothetical protein [Clostridium sp. C2-6-12]|uniref:hypothetical protein n=1 Tax=Clostridium sp. C2-6-12 TaxID=2698832 RepID=UPI00136F49D8|nr:hypothetical protein [Clostridium sp. C2-6-12]